MDKELNAKLFHIFEDLIDTHVTACMEKKIIGGCYIDQPIEKATKAVQRLLIGAKQTECNDILNIMANEGWEGVKTLSERYYKYEKQLAEIGGGL